MLCCAAAKSLPARPHISAIACMYSNGVTSEHHHLAHRLALVQPVEPDIDLVELQPAAHEPVDRKLSAAVERDIPRQVAGRHAGSDVAALHGAFLGDEIDLRQG